ncbi:MAG: hypothetical protein KA248_00240 [Kiritimatiellae bacterium]|nr:hypothetical protein [Kiritimatiellia bacterium]
MQQFNRNFSILLLFALLWIVPKHCHAEFIREIVWPRFPTDSEIEKAYQVASQLDHPLWVSKAYKFHNPRLLRKNVDGRLYSYTIDDGAVNARMGVVFYKVAGGKVLWSWLDYDNAQNEWKFRTQVRGEGSFTDAELIRKAEIEVDEIYKPESNHGYGYTPGFPDLDSSEWEVVTGSGGTSDLPVLPIAVGTGVTLAVLGAAKKLLAKSNAAQKPQAQEKAESRDKKNEVVGYVLQLSSDRLEVAVGRPAPLRVNVWKVDGWGTPTVATDASITLSHPNTREIVVDPVTVNGGVLNASVRLLGTPTVPEAEIKVRAQTNTSSHEATVKIGWVKKARFRLKVRPSDLQELSLNNPEVRNSLAREFYVDINIP